MIQAASSSRVTGMRRSRRMDGSMVTTMVWSKVAKKTPAETAARDRPGPLANRRMRGPVALAGGLGTHRFTPGIPGAAPAIASRIAFAVRGLNRDLFAEIGEDKVADGLLRLSRRGRPFKTDLSHEIVVDPDPDLCGEGFHAVHRLDYGLHLLGGSGAAKVVGLGAVDLFPPQVLRLLDLLENPYHAFAQVEVAHRAERRRDHLPGRGSGRAQVVSILDRHEFDLDRDPVLQQVDAGPHAPLDRDIAL